MITADQLLAHAIGDYILQTDWMATEKTKKSLAALVHVVTYALPFLLITTSWPAISVIVGTHFIIDRWRLARQFIWFKNRLLTPFVELEGWSECSATGFSPARPPWLAVWLLIFTDNIMHVTINGLAIMWLA